MGLLKASHPEGEQSETEIWRRTLFVPDIDEPAHGDEENTLIIDDKNRRNNVNNMFPV
jgi:hypothetical protein